MEIPQKTDIIVVGAGPAGATSARFAALSGLSVLLVDKKQELGAPIQCSGAVSAHALQDARVDISPEFVLTPIFGFQVYNAEGSSRCLDYRILKPSAYADNPLGYVVDRRRFDRHLSAQAERAGATLLLKTEATGYRKLPSGNIAVHLRRFGQSHWVETAVLVGADGIQSQVGKWAGIRTQIRLSELASCLQYVVDGVESSSLLEIICGHRWAPGGYAWVFPKSCGYCEVGLGIIRTMTDHDARWHLDHFMNESFMAGRFKNARVIEVQGGGVPLAAPLREQVADNVILVGDAARHVNPITGGGIHTALRAGKIAGEFLGAFLKSGEKPAAERLYGYHKIWHSDIGKSMWKLYREKRAVFRLQEFAARDEQLYQTLSSYFAPESEYRKI